MATACHLPEFTESFQTTHTDDLRTNESGSSSSSCYKEPSKTSGFFYSASTHYQSKVQQLISFSFTSSFHLLFITCILSISKFCNAAALNAAQVTAATPTASEIMHNLSGSALLERLKASTLGPTLDQLKHLAPAAANSISPSPSGSGSGMGIGMGNFGNSINSVFNGNPLKFLNVSGKIGTPLDISLSLSNHCDEKQFQCSTGECIPIRWACDGHSDCRDHSDERLEECKFIESTCSQEQFRCGTGKCIPQRWLCDRENDCADGSDEAASHCRTQTCSPEQFACKSGEGECIPLSWMCDQTKDCRDGSDEAQCNRTCRSDEFTCGNGRCIQNRFKCDQDDDCGDGSDEKNCGDKPKCAPDTFQCSSGTCIPSEWLCDGDHDCYNGEDEMQNCTRINIRFCEASEFQCSDHITCLHRTWVCDGEADCPDGEDESPANCPSVSCRPDQFQCDDRSCIAGHLTCNGDRDCSDGSDEKNCSINATPRECNATSEFDCGGGQCIALEKVCNRKKDCPNGEDEPAGKCDINECATNNGGCMHQCEDLEVGYKCVCHDGYRLAENQRTCVDIDECETPGICSQVCVNEIGAFKCECEAGYMRLLKNHTRCKASEGHASLLLARRHDIRKIALDRPEMTSIVNSTKASTALDFVFRTGMIFWSDVSTKSIYKAPIDEGSEKTVVLTKSSVTSDGLAVDWIYNHVYYTDTEKCTIELTNFEGSMGKVLVKDALDIPRSIALDPIDGWMYWSDWGASPRIERAGMDGSHRTAIITYDVKWPNGITLDLVQKKLYWVDGKLNSISSANYDGSQRRQVLYSSEYLKHPFSITTFEDWVYWTDWDKQAVFKANKFNGQDVEPVTATHMLEHPMVVHVYHPYRQPDGVNHCQSVNGHCSHLCLPAPRINERSPRISCACPTGLKLMPDGLMCVEDLRIPKVLPTAPIHRTTDQSSIATTKLPQDAHSEAPVEEKTGGNTTSTDDKVDKSAKKPEKDYGLIAMIVIACLTGTAVVAGVIFVFYRRCTRAVNSMNFENPVYHKTTEDHFSLEKNVTPHMYATAMEEESVNPLFEPGTECV
ncbi:very low-density lipoprotein receptor isoform X1 [Drosophila takahashii]|uniref:very low-density lipoprotein receptor isoform X1 n=1 Tax=Drosophila takahashii TaxID=29030 RepID=UPI001CF8AB6A|nr:very low-density lipoprotein receptor isoform X1 [Drosophila takahashii]